MNDVADLRDTIQPKSDQLNADQLLGGPITIKVTDVRRGSDEQPVIISYENDGGRPYKPCKSMRKLLIFAWGDDGRGWIGKSMTLYNDPDVKYGGVKVGGIRISHLSHIEQDIIVSITATRGKKEPVKVRRLAAQLAAPAPAPTPAPAGAHLQPLNIEELQRSCEENAALGFAVFAPFWNSLSKEHRAALGGAAYRDMLIAKAKKADARTDDDCPI